MLLNKVYSHTVSPDACFRQSCQYLRGWYPRLVMDLKYHDIINFVCITSMALHRQDEGVGGLIIIIWACVNTGSYHVHTYNIICISACLVCVGVAHFEGVVSFTS